VITIIKMASTTVFVAALCLACASFAAAGSNKEGVDFLAANKGKDGVITLPSGMQYKVLRKGGGGFHPKVGTSCECHYEGKLIDGTVFDSSYARGSPTSFAPNQVIKGWTEAMQLMVEGDQWEMYIPSELGYGDSGSPPKIKGGDLLIFKMEIIKINGDKVPAMRCDALTLEGCDDKEKKFIEKAGNKFTSEALIKAEIARLAKTMGGKMKPALLAWINRRTNILNQMATSKKEEL